MGLAESSWSGSKTLCSLLFAQRTCLCDAQPRRDWRQQHCLALGMEGGEGLRCSAPSFPLVPKQSADKPQVLALLCSPYFHISDTELH